MGLFGSEALEQYEAELKKELAKIKAENEALRTENTALKKMIQTPELVRVDTSKCVWTRDKKAVACVRFDIECYPGGYAIDWAEPDCDIGFKHCPYCGKEIENKEATDE